MIPLGHAPHYVGGKFYEALQEKIGGIVTEYGTLPYGLNLEIAPIVGQDVGANALGYLALYFNLRQVAQLNLSALPTTRTAMPWAANVFNFAGGWNYSVVGLSGPLTVTATSSGCTHSPPNFVITTTQVTYAVNQYLTGSNAASCQITITAKDPTGRQVSKTVSATWY